VFSELGSIQISNVGESNCTMESTVERTHLIRSKLFRHIFVVSILIVFSLVNAGGSLADESKYREFLQRVSAEIVALKGSYPQLREFSVETHVDFENLRIDYGYHTHSSAETVGWRAGVPGPDGDGIWFYIGIHDKDSSAQIHSQPFKREDLKVGDREIRFLILEGSETEPLAGLISSILRQD